MRLARTFASSLFMQSGGPAACGSGHLLTLPPSDTFRLADRMVPHGPCFHRPDRFAPGPAGAGLVPNPQRVRQHLVTRVLNSLRPGDGEYHWRLSQESLTAAWPSITREERFAVALKIAREAGREISASIPHFDLTHAQRFAVAMECALDRHDGGVVHHIDNCGLRPNERFAVLLRAAAHCGCFKLEGLDQTQRFAVLQAGARCNAWETRNALSRAGLTPEQNCQVACLIAQEFWWAARDVLPHLGLDADQVARVWHAGLVFHPLHAWQNLAGRDALDIAALAPTDAADAKRLARSFRRFAKKQPAVLPMSWVDLLWDRVPRVDTGLGLLRLLGRLELRGEALPPDSAAAWARGMGLVSAHESAIRAVSSPKLLGAIWQTGLDLEARLGDAPFANWPIDSQVWTPAHIDRWLQVLDWWRARLHQLRNTPEAWAEIREASGAVTAERLGDIAMTMRQASLAPVLRCFSAAWQLTEDELHNIRSRWDTLEPVFRAVARLDPEQFRDLFRRTGMFAAHLIHEYDDAAGCEGGAAYEASRVPVGAEVIHEAVTKRAAETMVRRRADGPSYLSREHPDLNGAEHFEVALRGLTSGEGWVLENIRYHELPEEQRFVGALLAAAGRGDDISYYIGRCELPRAQRHLVAQVAIATAPYRALQQLGNYRLRHTQELAVISTGIAYHPLAVLAWLAHGRPLALGPARLLLAKPKRPPGAAMLAVSRGSEQDMRAAWDLMHAVHRRQDAGPAETLSAITDVAAAHGMALTPAHIETLATHPHVARAVTDLAVRLRAWKASEEKNPVWLPAHLPAVQDAEMATCLHWLPMLAPYGHMVREAMKAIGQWDDVPSAVRIAQLTPDQLYMALLLIAPTAPVIVAQALPHLTLPLSRRFRLACLAASGRTDWRKDHLPAFGLPRAQRDVVHHVALTANPDLLDGWLFGSANTSFAMATQAFSERHPVVLPPEWVQLMWARGEREFAARGLLRTCAARSRRGLVLPGDPVPVWAEAMGLEVPPLWQAVTHPRDRQRMSSNMLGDFFELGFDLEQRLGSAPFAAVAVDPSVWAPPFRHAWKTVFRLMRDLLALGAPGEKTDTATVWTQVLAVVGEIRAERLGEMAERLQRAVVDAVQILFAGEKVSCTYAQLQRVEKRWGDLEIFLTLAARYRGQASWRDELPVLARIFHAVLHDRFEPLKFAGHPADPDDQVAARRQLAMLTTRQQIAAWKAPRWRLDATIHNGAVTADQIRQAVAGTVQHQLLPHLPPLSAPLAPDVADRVLQAVTQRGASPRATAERLRQDMHVAPESIVHAVAHAMPGAELSQVAACTHFLRSAGNTLQLSAQVRNDLQTIAGHLLTRDNAGRGNHLVFTTTSWDPKLLLEIGDLVGTHTCQSYATGGSAHSLPGYVIDADVQAIASFVIGPVHLPASAFEAIRQACLAGAAVTCVFHAAQHAVTISWHAPGAPAQQVTTRPLGMARLRHILKLGTAPSGRPALRLEPAYEQLHAGTSLMYAQVRQIEAELGSALSADPDGPVSFAGSRNPGAVYSDLAGGIKTGPYTII